MILRYLLCPLVIPAKTETQPPRALELAAFAGFLGPACRPFHNSAHYRQRQRSGGLGRRGTRRHALSVISGRRASTRRRPENCPRRRRTYAATGAFDCLGRSARLAERPRHCCAPAGEPLRPPGTGQRRSTDTRPVGERKSVVRIASFANKNQRSAPRASWRTPAVRRPGLRRDVRANAVTSVSFSAGRPPPARSTRRPAI